MKRLFLFVPILLLSGCIVLPMPTTTPFKPETIKPLETKRASRDEVRATLGRGYVSRLNGKYWIYGNVQPSFFLAVFAPSGGAADTIYRVRWLALRFDEAGRVDKIWRMDRLRDCTDTDICVIGGGFLQSMRQLCKEGGCDLDPMHPKQIAARERLGVAAWERLGMAVVLTAPVAMDQAAKRFETKADQCAVYVYATSFRSNHWPGFTLDSDMRVAVTLSTYALIWVGPGEHKLRSLPLMKHTQKAMHFVCTPPATMFVKVHFKGFFRLSVIMDLRDAATAKTAIAERRLRLPR